MEDKENNSYTYTQKIISQVVSNNDKETIKAITRYCEENNVYPNLISEEKLKEVIELGLKNERLQQENKLLKAKLEKIEDTTTFYMNWLQDSDLVKRIVVDEQNETLLKIIKGEEE